MKRKNYAGFTIIELMVAIAVAAILLAVAIPSYTNMVLNNCLTTKANGFVSAMQLARSTAITFRDNVSVGALDCRLDADDDDAADGVCDNANEFGQGLVVYRDIDGDGLADPAVDEDINDNGILDPGEDLNANEVIDAEVIKRVRFSCAATMNETSDSEVLVYGPNGGATPLGTIDICDTRAPGTYNGRRITLSTTGRPTTDPTFTCP